MVCLEPGCHLPADLIDTFTLPSTGGPVLHGVWQCVARHRLWGDRRLEPLMDSHAVLVRELVALGILVAVLIGAAVALAIWDR